MRCLAILITTILLATLSANVQAAAAGQRAQQGHAVSKAKHRHSITRHRAAVKRAYDARTRLREQVSLARNAEQSVRRRYEGQGGSQARNIVRRATLERANLENQLSDADARYQSALSTYRAAKANRQGTRKDAWQAAVASKQGKSGKKGRKLKIAATPLGPTGSGNSQPSKPTRGILKTASR